MGVAGKVFAVLTYKGGLIATGAVCYILSKRNILPPYMVTIAFGLSYVGALGVFQRFVLKESSESGSNGKIANGEIEVDEESDSSDIEITSSRQYDARMKEFDELKPKLKQMMAQQAQMLKEVEDLTKKQKTLQEWIDESRELDRRLAARGLLGTTSELQDTATEVQPNTNKQECANADTAGREEDLVKSESANTSGAEEIRELLKDDES